MAAIDAVYESYLFNMSDLRGYKVSVLCDYPHWWRFNIFLIVVSFDSKQQMIQYQNHVDKVYEAGNLVNEPPLHYDPDRRIELTTPPCSYIKIYLYAMPSTFPDSNIIRNSPPFEALLEITGGDNEVHRKVLEVNQWGGYTLAAYQIP